MYDKVSDSIRSLIVLVADKEGISSYDLAKKTGINKSTVQRFIDGDGPINSGYLSRICKALEIKFIHLSHAPLIDLKN